MAGNQKSERKALLKLVLGTFVALILMTGLNVVFIINSVGRNLFKPLKRNLASVTPVVKATPEKLFSPVIHIDCREQKENQTHKTKAPSARFLFKNCKKISKIINQTNNNQGHFFAFKEDLGTSDFISLKKGHNHIIVVADKKTQTIEIKREKDKGKAPAKAL